MNNIKITIEDEYDGFVISINDKRFRFDQEDTHEDLVLVFREILGINVDITYEVTC